MATFDMSDSPTQSADAVDVSAADVQLGNARFIRAGGAGNIVMRYPLSAADVSVNAAAGEYVPVGPGVIVRKGGTTATGMIVFGR